MPGYLLDSNHVSALYNKNAKVIARLQAVGEAHLRTCAIVLGEIEAGHKMTAAGCTNPARRNDYVAWVTTKFHPHVCPITLTTRAYYADILARLWDAHGPKSSSKGKKVKTERLLNSLGIDINDVWIAASAWEHGLTLVTHDGMVQVRGALAALGQVPEDWMA